MWDQHAKPNRDRPNARPQWKCPESPLRLLPVSELARKAFEASRVLRLATPAAVESALAGQQTAEAIRNTDRRVRHRGHRRSHHALSSAFSGQRNGVRFPSYYCRADLLCFVTLTLNSCAWGRRCEEAVFVCGWRHGWSTANTSSACSLRSSAATPVCDVGSSCAWRHCGLRVMWCRLFRATSTVLCCAGAYRLTRCGKKRK